MDRINILAIDGGGMYGVVAAEVLIHLEDALGNLNTVFDLMAGTSTGSVLTAGLLTGHHSAELQHLYFEEGPNIFRKPRKKVLGLFRSGPKYKGKYLRDALNKYYGDRTMGSLDGRLMVSAYDMSHQQTHYFKSWEDTELLIRDVVVASSSAPTFHPMHRINDICYTDGGVFASNPSIGALGEAFKLRGFNNNTKINVVSIGTGWVLKGRDCSDKTRRRGDLWWLDEVPGVFLDGMDEVPDTLLTCLNNDPTSRVTYHRLDVHVSSKKSDELDTEKLYGSVRAMKNYLYKGEGRDKLNKTIESLS